MPLTYIHLVVHGKVQGVFFRKHTAAKGQALRLRGTVRNCDDGSVEVWAVSDSAAALSEFQTWCSRVGSPKSRIDRVVEDSGDFDPANAALAAAYATNPFGVLR